MGPKPFLSRSWVMHSSIYTYSIYISLHVHVVRLVDRGFDSRSQPLWTIYFREAQKT